MLSILIPIYNFDVRPLVMELNRQAQLLDVPCEIICLDDASTISFQKMNRELKKLEKVHYEELGVNVGRARIRNLLADKSPFDYLLFMDGDSGVPDEYYLSRYLSLLPTDDVLYGGRIYQQDPPADPDLFFHWWYGKNREQMGATERAMHPHHGFMTNNFLIPKRQFDRIRFDEQIRQYGHEDTLFGLQLKTQGIDIVHLDNPLEHLGLEKKEVFLHKSKLALENLVELASRYSDLDTKLIRTSKKISRFQLLPLIRLLTSVFRPLCLRNLSGKHPSLFFFDLLKLGYFLEEQNRKRNASE